MPLAIVITKDKDTALALEGRGFELKNTSSKGTYFYAKREDGKTAELLKGLPKAVQVSSEQLQEIFSKNTGWGGEDYTVPQNVEDDLVSKLLGMKLGGGRKQKRKTVSKKKRGPKKTRCLRSKRK